MKKNITVTFTPAEQKVLIEALAYWETVLEDQRDGVGLPTSHPLIRAWRKWEEARRG